MAGVSREARQLAGEDALWEALVRRDLWGQPTRADKQTAQRRGWQALYQDLHSAPLTLLVICNRYTKLSLH